MKRIIIIVALGCIGLAGCEPILGSSLANRPEKFSQNTTPVLGSDAPAPMLSSDTPTGGSNR